MVFANLQPVQLYGVPIASLTIANRSRDLPPAQTEGYATVVMHHEAELTISPFPEHLFEDCTEFKNGFRLPWLIGFDPKRNRQVVLEDVSVETITVKVEAAPDDVLIVDLYTRGGILSFEETKWAHDPEFQALTADWFARSIRGDDIMPVLADWLSDHGHEHEASRTRNFRQPWQVNEANQPVVTR